MTSVHRQTWSFRLVLLGPEAEFGKALQPRTKNFFIDIVWTMSVIAGMVFFMKNLGGGKKIKKDYNVSR